MTLPNPQTPWVYDFLCRGCGVRYGMGPVTPAVLEQAKAYASPGFHNFDFASGTAVHNQNEVNATTIDCGVCGAGNVLPVVYDARTPA